MFEYPPYPYLKQIADHCPKAVSLYMDLWTKKSDDHKLTVYKKDISSLFLVSPARFKSDMLHLVREGLASIDESPLMLVIELVGYDENFDETGEFACE